MNDTILPCFQIQSNAIKFIRNYALLYFISVNYIEANDIKTTVHVIMSYLSDNKLVQLEP